MVISVFRLSTLKGVIMKGTLILCLETSLWLLLLCSFPIDTRANGYEQSLFDISFNEVRKFYKTPHKIRKMFVQDSQTTSGSRLGGLFFSFISENQTVTNVRFCWEISNKTYIVTTIPIEKVRIRLVEGGEAPNVSFFLDEFIIKETFEWELRGGMENVEKNLTRILKNYMTPQETFSRFLAYATITVRGEDWPTNINLPVNKSFSN